MPKPKSLVLRAPGTNCDQETVHAFELAGAESNSVHINRLIEQPELLDEADILCLAGGFSFGDDLGAGRVLATQLNLNLHDALSGFRDRGKLILGICNGFQVLVQAKLLLTDTDGNRFGALGFNESGKFEDRWVNLMIQSPKCVFLRGLQQLYLPVAHAEGRVALRDPAHLRQLRENGEIALTYSDATGSKPEAVAYPENPNGADGGIAGVCDSSGRILGLMPHPERFVHGTHHPRWTREKIPDEGEGLQLFKNAVEYCR